MVIVVMYGLDLVDDSAKISSAYIRNGGVYVCLCECVMCLLAWHIGGPGAVCLTVVVALVS